MDSYNFDIQGDITLSDTLVAQLEEAISAILRYEGVAPPAGLSLLLTDDSRLQELNRMYRDIDAPTDVLSFPAGEEMPGMETMPPYLGDIAISQSYAGRQAVAGGHSLAAELQLLAIHGVLHLLGHDHVEPEEKRRMWQAQAAVLAQLGLPPLVPAGDDHA
jgi:probable rRNA maturation factor